MAILIIMIIGIGCGYFISQHSTTVGHAIADVSKSTVSLPHGFSAGPADDNSLKLVNRNNDEEIFIKDLGAGDAAQKIFKSSLKNISGSEYKKVIDNTTITTSKGLKVYAIHYVDSNKESPKYKCKAYFYTYGHTFYTKFTEFDDIDDLNEKIIFISDSIQPDYKKPRNPQEKQSDFSVDMNDVRS